MDWTPEDEVARRTTAATQYAALCYRLRKSGRWQILLVTSRGTGRWIPPKGWPIKGLTPSRTARVEAHEEAGVKGKALPFAAGRYDYRKGSGPAREAWIFPLRVKSRSRKFKEKGQRKVKWFAPAKAAALVREPGLARIIRAFDPHRLPARPKDAGAKKKKRKADGAE